MRLIDQLQVFVRAYLDANAGVQNAGKKLADQTTNDITSPILNGDEAKYYLYSTATKLASRLNCYSLRNT